MSLLLQFIYSSRNFLSEPDRLQLTYSSYFLKLIIYYLYFFRKLFGH